jgi:hypothetical protein
VQFAKDSFYIAMRERLVEVNPERAVVVDGVVRPAVVVKENQAGDLTGMDQVFRLAWGECASVGGSDLMKIRCTIEYATRGVDGTGGDRGRTLAALDRELMAIAQPPRTAKKNYAMVPATSLGTMVFWTELEFTAPKDEAGRMSRTASTTVYFVSEVGR